MRNTIGMMHVLQICIVDDCDEFKIKTMEMVEKHNRMIRENPNPDSGFDLLTPNSDIVHTTRLLPFGIKARMLHPDGRPVAFALFARSSIYKTSLMLANHVGVIDAGYRGELKGAFRNLGIVPEQIEQYTRLVQVCLPSLEPFLVVVVDELGDETIRGEGGFGSTG